jgi:hypothetical protein
MSEDNSEVVREDDAVGSEIEDLDEEEFETFLADAICYYAEEDNVPRTHIRTFAEAGLLTGNRGLVVHVGDAEFQVTIVRSR